jgi:hypothetical protein
MNWEKIERVGCIILGLAILVVLVLQLSSLYVTPIHNSQLWYGDESWLMNEYREQMSTGVFRHPGAIASTLQIGNPFPFTSMWITSLLYGGTANIFASSNLVDVGRTVSALIALAVVALVLWRVGKESMISALCGIALLVSCRSYLFASHCSRYDIITAATVMIGMMYLSNREKFSAKEFLLVGLLFGGCLLVSAHAFAMLALPVAFIALRNQRSPFKLAPMVLACLGVIGSLYLIHLLTQPSLPSTHDVTYSVGDQPIMQPFSLSFQLYNIQQKIKLVIKFALPLIIMLTVILVANYRGSSKSWSNILFWSLPVFAWFFLEAAAPSYLIYVLPALALGTALGTHRLSRGGRIVTLVVCVVMLLFASQDALQARRNGKQLTQNVRLAIDIARPYLGDQPLITTNPGLSDLENDLAFSGRVLTAHFVLLPNIPQRTVKKEGSLMLFVKDRDPYFSWEVPILRSEFKNPNLVLTGQYLDAKTSYFKPLDGSQDTLFVQRLDLDTFLQHYRR